MLEPNTNTQKSSVMETNIAAMVYDLTNRPSTTLIERQGSNLVIKLSNGEEVVIESFFIAFSEQDFHAMQGGVYNPVIEGVDIPFETVIEPDAFDNDGQVASDGEVGSLGAMMIAGAGLAVAAGGLGSSDDDDDPTPREAALQQSANRSEPLPPASFSLDEDEVNEEGEVTEDEIVELTEEQSDGAVIDDETMEGAEFFAEMMPADDFDAWNTNSQGDVT